MATAGCRQHITAAQRFVLIDDEEASCANG